MIQIAKKLPPWHRLLAAVLILPIGGYFLSQALSRPLDSIETKKHNVAHFFCLCSTPSKCVEVCDTAVTYKDPTAPYDMPGSTWTTARNGMYLLAKDRIRQARERKATPERYFCFMDGDVLFSPENKLRFLKRLSKEKEWRKIVSPPSYWSTLRAEGYAEGNAEGFKYVYWNDAMLNCFEARALDLYLPYRSAKDNTSWWLSQQDLIWRGNMIEPLPFKVYTGEGMIMNNDEHNPYPQGGGEAELRNSYYSGYSTSCTPESPWGINRTISCTYKGRPVYQIDFDASPKLLIA